MNSSISSGAFRTARSTISVYIFFTAILTIALVSERLGFENSFTKASETMVTATSVTDRIKLADERLTMSANLAAVSGAQRWIDRYNSYIPDIDSAISAAISMASPEVAERFDRETRFANDALVGMEAQSFKAVNAGDLKIAKTILASDAYAQQKELLTAGTDRLLNSVITAAQSQLKSVQIIGRLALASVALISALALGLLWRFTARKIRTSEASYQDAELKLNFMARHDELTSLPNRRTFVELLTSHLRQQRETSYGLVAVAMVDVDHFKDINDTLGHKCGDELLKALPARFKSGMPDRAIFARFGGDEFAIALPISDEGEVKAHFNQLVDSISYPFEIEGQTLPISISVGIALSPCHATTADELLRFADIALYEAKANGRNRMQLFAPEMDELKRGLREIETDLRTALKTGELAMFYQPLFSQDGSAIIGLEALLRWRHPERGMVPPASFVPVAENSGLIVSLGAWAIRRAFEDSFQWPELRLAINLSPVQLRHPDFLRSLQTLLAATHADPSRFDFEITEGVLLEDNWRIRGLLNDLRSLGFGIALDDFGTGYSSLSYLRKFPFTKLKIDQSFIKRLETSPDAAQIVYSIIQMSRAMGLTVTAEGVENAAQHQFLAAAGCQQMQGFLFAGVLSREGIDNLLQTRGIRRESSLS